MLSADDWQRGGRVSVLLHWPRRPNQTATDLTQDYLDIQPADLMRYVEWLNEWQHDNFLTLYIAGRRAGHLKPAMCEALAQWPDFFTVGEERVDMTVGADDFDQRSRVLEEVTHALVDQQLIPAYLDEPYGVTGHGHEDVIALLDRGAAGYFGIRTYGQHINGFVRDAERIRMWIGRRAPDRAHFPDKLDNFVAGGLPYNQTLHQNLLKECHEEAGVAADLAATARPVGAVSYCRETAIGLKPDALYCYDLELPSDFEPRNTDGEVAEFSLLDLQQVLEIARDGDEFKTNCVLVIIDFAYRHGLFDAELPGYLELLQGLRQKSW
jgi:8-oxo-dGTP pyrophosphatase MutT (NUDIX family)